MNNYQDDMTLGEIGENDLEMTEDAIKNANKYTFDTKNKAMLFIKHCMDCTLKHVGIVVNVPKSKFAQIMYEHTLNKQMKDAGVEIETRRHYKGKDIWRNGIYIQKDGVLVAFISNVLANVKESYSKDAMKLVRSSVGYFVITNSRTDNIKRVYGGENGKPKALILPPSSRN